MSYAAVPYADTDFSELHTAIVRWYAGWNRPDNWLMGRLEDWRYGGNAQRNRDNPGFWAENARCFRDDTGVLAGFVVNEYGGDDLFLQVDPARRDVEPVMLDWIETVWAAGRARIGVFALAGDTARANLLRAHGFVDDGSDGNMYRYDLTRAYPVAPLPAGFTVTTLAENRDFGAQAAAIGAAFGNQKVDESLLAFRRTAPGYSLDWDLVVVAPDGRHASFACIWVDWENRLAEIDPIGTQPEFQRRGLARAGILDGFRRLAAVGIHTAYIGAGPEPAAGNFLYAGLGPVAKYPFIRWRKASA